MSTAKRAIRRKRQALECRSSSWILSRRLWAIQLPLMGVTVVLESLCASKVLCGHPAGRIVRSRCSDESGA